LAREQGFSVIDVQPIDPGVARNNRLEFDTVCPSPQALEQLAWSVTVPGTPSACQY
jgi:hypothetical protein